MNDFQSGQLRILAVDDEQVTLDLYRQVLFLEKMKDQEMFSEIGALAGKLFGETMASTQSLSFELVVCRQGDEAVETVQRSLKENTPFAVAFLDIRMPPGPDGIWVAEQIRALDPHIEIVIVTGYSDIHPRDIAQRVLPAHKLLYIQKPFHPQEISQFASALGSKWQTEYELQKAHENLERRVKERTIKLMKINERLKEEIEERNRTEEHSYQLEQAVETMQLGVMIIDLDGTIIYTNLAGAEMHGYQVEELLGQDVSILASPEPQKPPALHQIKIQKGGLTRESLHIRKDRTTFPVWLMSEVVKDAQGEPCAIVTSCEDITERKQAEEVLRKSEEKYRTVLEAAPDPVAVYDMEEKITYLNPAFTRVFGWTLEESFGRTIDFVPVENLPETRLIFEKINHGETISGVETCRLTRDGNRLDVSISGAGFFDSHGKLQGSVITIQDITAHKKTEEKIKFLAYHDVLNAACQQAAKWHNMGHTDFYVAVNLSARQFKEPDLVETVEQVLDMTGLPPDSLRLEITESGIMENPKQAIAKMKMLRTKGIRFSLDDFGTGYSSLSYLKRFPIDTLKIDRSFVMDCITNKDDQEIIKTIIAMARNLDMDTVAEGVETEEQQDFLIGQGCHIMQGYHFGRPMPADRFEEMLQRSLI